MKYYVLKQILLSSDKILSDTSKNLALLTKFLLDKEDLVKIANKEENTKIEENKIEDKRKQIIKDYKMREMLFKKDNFSNPILIKDKFAY